MALNIFKIATAPLTFFILTVQIISFPIQVHMNNGQEAENRGYRYFCAPLENLELISADFLIMSFLCASSNLLTPRSWSRSKGRLSCDSLFSFFFFFFNLFSCFSSKLSVPLFFFRSSATFPKASSLALLMRCCVVSPSWSSSSPRALFSRSSGVSVHADLSPSSDLPFFRNVL